MGDDLQLLNGYQRVAIVGSRDYPDLNDVHRYVESLPENTIVVSGGAQGVDKRAENAARFYGLPFLIIPARWEHGRGAGFIRNQLIVAAADRVVAFWDGKSKGTKHTIDIAHSDGKPVQVYLPGQYGREQS